MNLRQILSITILGASSATAGVALAHDGDGVPTRTHAQEFATPPVRVADVDRRAGDGAQLNDRSVAFKTARVARSAEPFALNVPGRPEFGRVASP